MNLLYTLLFSPLCLMVFQGCIATERSVNIEGKVNINSWIQKDHVGNIYDIENENALHLIPANDGQAYSYSDPSYNTISRIDISDPYKIVIFFKNIQIIRVLDNTLSPLYDLDLNRENETFYNVACRSQDENYWLFEESSQKLQLIGGDAKIQVESFPLYQEGPEGFSSDFILCDEEKVILSDLEHGIVIYDLFAAFVRFIPLKGVHLLASQKDKIFYQKDSKIYTYDLNVFEENVLLDLKDKTAKRYHLDPIKEKIRFYNEKYEVIYLSENIIP